MLVKLKNEGMAGEGISVGTRTYLCDHKGEVAVEKDDANVLVSLAGFQRIGEISEDHALAKSSIRPPETRAEFMAMIRKCGLTGDDLRAMANNMDAEMGLLPNEGAEPEGFDPGGGGSGQIAEPKVTVKDPSPEESARLQRYRRKRDGTGQQSAETNEEVTQ
jgi:hypothetical protein